MKKCCILNSLVLLIIGAVIGGAAVYYKGICKTSGTSIQLNSSADAGPGITITKTGDSQ
ncbi:MAG: hypothetical protein NTZ67_09190 [Gammaproteobacteria bacterium]|nr:hypothetical protein [Gammaproteobacteria bacterium]